jgi:hypothetical protein
VKSSVSLFVLVVCVSATAGAQQAPGVGSVQPPATGNVADWGVTTEAAGSASVVPVGTAMRITATTETAVKRSAWVARGRFQVRATIHRAPASATGAAYGLVLGDRGTGEHVAFLVRPDGFAAIEQHRQAGVTTLRDWTRASALSASAPDGSALDAVEVRVDATRATLAINGEEVVTIPITAGQLDGTPGLHVGAGGDLTVAALTVAGDSVVGMPGVAPVIR